LEDIDVASQKSYSSEKISPSKINKAIIKEISKSPDQASQIKLKLTKTVFLHNQKDIDDWRKSKTIDFILAEVVGSIHDIPFAQFKKV
jgi:hypothetical protein